MDNLEGPREPISSDLAEESRPLTTTPLMTLVLAIAGLGRWNASEAGHLSGGSTPTENRPTLGEEPPLDPRALRLGSTPGKSEGHNKPSMSPHSCLDVNGVPGVPVL